MDGRTQRHTTTANTRASYRRMGNKTHQKAGHRQVRAISTCRDSSNLSATCFRSKKSRKLVADSHERVESQVLNQVCDQDCDLDIVMEFGL